MMALLHNRNLAPNPCFGAANVRPISAAGPRFPSSLSPTERLAEIAPFARISLNDLDRLER